ncbi:ATPase family AAA domain-containing protein 2-like [Cheilinus undulatus]|uniref:ATPase family AAA domain-containing protein 2-like n=1 Tax=Cheilinus undulatus TaxID=241271 RepID=UPI001BD4FC15|nr:ATPase family AAA domain-containing protein 2-like [Cheilinus undulatus]
MVTLRGRGRGDADVSGGAPGRKQQRPGGSSTTPPKSPAESRRRSTVTRQEEPGLSDVSPVRGFTTEDDEDNHVSDSQEEEEEERLKPERRVSRTSVRRLSSRGRRRSRLRRSTRTVKPTDRYEAFSMFDGINSSVARSVLDNMDSMKKKRRLRNSREGKIYSKAQRRRTPVLQPEDLSDTEDDEAAAGEDDHGAETTADDDSSGSLNPNFNAKVSRASALYQGPDSDFPRGTFRISASGPNTTRRGAFSLTAVVLSKSLMMKPKSQSSWKRQDEIRSGSGRQLRLQNQSFKPQPLLHRLSKEMVVFPLLYPEVFENFKIQPPRGCLFYGPPGTGKTLVARALANECRLGNRKVSFFMRKGADCLSKWVGESERQLRLLFEQAYQLRPSIIFFDEIDGLAPVRSSRQDQIHSSIVSTLLALMDGLDSRGEVVVIGATNRLDSIDPALRRPGRFDREFLFGLPDRESRKEILKIHTMQWKPPPSEDFLDELAEKCVGYCGADIRAVCTEAALCALRRRYPQIYGTAQKLLLDVSSISVSSCDFVSAMKKMTPAAHRLAGTPAKPLSAVVQPLLSAALQDILEALQRLFPHAEQGMKRKREPDLTAGVLEDGLMGGDAENSSPISLPSTSKSSKFLHFARSAVRHPTSHRPRMLLAGRPGSGQTSHLAPAVLHALERLSVHSLDSAVLFGVSSTSPEEACAQMFMEAKRTSPSILYLPHIQQWWETVGPALRASFLSLLDSIPSFSPILLLATSSLPHQQLDPEIQFLFREEYGELYTLSAPTPQQRSDFFQDLILNQAAEAPPSKTKPVAQATEILPLAPSPPPRLVPDEEQRRLEEQEEDVLRELRLFLRNVTERLSLDRRFKSFSKPVDIEEVPDYLMVIRKPMDFSTLLTNIDEHRYATVGEFMSDADLIWRNALKYNPDSDPMDRHIRHRACALKDTVYAIIRDELDEDFERVCEEIRESRLLRASGADTNRRRSPSKRLRAQKKKCYKRPRRSKWSAGIIPKPKKKKPPTPPPSPSSPSSSPSSLSSPGNSESDLSESSFEQSPPASTHSNGDAGVLVNGYHRPKLNGILKGQTRSSKTPLRKKRAVNGVCLRLTEKHRRPESRAALEQMLSRRRPEENLTKESPGLMVDHSKLRDLLSRVVAKTDGAEVEPLEKLYARLAQSIYRHRNNYSKTELLQDMKTEINSFSS